MRWLGLTPSGSARRRALLAILVALLLAGAVEAYRATLVVQEVGQGRHLLQTGEDLLQSRRLDATRTELQAAKTDFEGARVTFASAHSTLRRDPLVWALGHLPLIGGQVDAAVALTEIGEEAAVAGAEGVGAADHLVVAQEEAEGTLPEQSLAIFKRTDPHFAALKARLGVIDGRRQAMDGDALLPPLRSAVGELDDRRERIGDLVATYDRARAFVPEFLGFSQPKRYLILAQNNAELLPTGGLVSVVGTLQVEDGRLEQLDFQDAVEFSRSWRLATNAYVEPPAPLRHYLLKDVTWNLAVSNWSPDFPTSARQAQHFFELGGGLPVDGVIGINVTTLQRLLAVTGPVAVPEFAATVDSENVFDLTEQHTRGPADVHTDRKEFVALLAEAVLERVLRPAPGTWSALVDVIQELGEEKNLLLYSSDSRQQELIRELDWDGEVGPASGDYLMLVDASVNSTKLNVALEEAVDMEVRLSEAGSATTTVTLDYSNKLAEWEQGKDPELVRRLMLGGLYGGYLRLFVPPGSRILEVRDASREIGLEEAGQELGLTVFGRFFALPRGTSQRLSFQYVVPMVVQASGDARTYRLKLQKQPGQQPLPLTLRVVPPDGMEIKSTVANGGVYPSDSDLQLALERDWLLEFELGPRS